jgi:glycosyltransferase involved in cell wall biosynthesis
MTKLSIIIPVYNVEKYVRSCLESIFQQGLDEADFEIIIVNDGTKDRSMEVIEDIISQHSNITVIDQENLSLSVARNNGIAAAKGEYILMPDSDDLLIENSLKPLLDKALETKADCVVADFLEIGDSSYRSLSYPISCYGEK